MVNGKEIANAYTELNDPITQEETFRMQLAGLKEEDSMAKMDDDFIRALKHGMPPAGGLGIGIDRLIWKARSENKCLHTNGFMPAKNILQINCFWNP